MFNTLMIAQALSVELIDKVGRNATFSQISDENPWGKAQAHTLEKYFTNIGWNQQFSYSVSPGQHDNSSLFSAVVGSGSIDVVFINSYGQNGVKAMQAVDSVAGDEVILVMPIINRTMVERASTAASGIYGTVAWGSFINTPLSKKFSDSYKARYNGRIPSGLAQQAYGQTLLYASAVERAGTFYPPEVIKTMEGMQYTMGLGREKLRRCDHQAIRPIPIVQGLHRDRFTTRAYFKPINVVRNIGYPCSNPPADSCRLDRA
jgi:ABC-type branched-subunit amino acid transport system substrate-binding protein